MRQISRYQILIFVSGLWLSTTDVLLAQSSNKSGKSVVQTAAKGPATGAKPSSAKSTSTDEPAKKDAATRKEVPKPPSANEPLDPDLDELLKKWEVSSAKIKTLHGEQTRSEFNSVFNVEKRSRGKFFLETPDKGRIDMMAVPVKKGDLSSKKGPNGESYSLETGQSERWICTGDEIVVIHEDDKTYEKQEIPAESRGANIVHSPLPFLFGMKADEAKSRFKMAMSPTKQKNIVMITAIPLLPKDQENYEIAWIVLDTTSFLPKFVRLRQDESGTETIYQFEKVVINGRGIKEQLSSIFNGDPYHPKLTGYTLAMPPQNNAKAPEENPAPGGGKPLSKSKSPPSVPSSAGKSKSSSTTTSGSGSKN